jgi:Family of unknown function (DUF5681)
MSGDNTRRKHGGHPNWEPGQSGNPKGRPKGSRNALSEDFFAALHADFVEHGVATIARVREEEPGQYLRVIAQTLPKELHVENAKVIEEMSALHPGNPGSSDSSQCHPRVRSDAQFN